MSKTDLQCLEDLADSLREHLERECVHARVDLVDGRRIVIELAPGVLV